MAVTGGVQGSLYKHLSIPAAKSKSEALIIKLGPRLQLPFSNGQGFLALDRYELRVAGPGPQKITGSWPLPFIGTPDSRNDPHRIQGLQGSPAGQGV